MTPRRGTGSPAVAWRVLAERGCRMVALGALGWALAMSLRGPGAARVGGVPRVVTLPVSLLTDTTGRGVAAWRAVLVRQAASAQATSGQAPSARDTAPERPDTLMLPLPVVPAAPLRAALGATVAAGLPLTWRDHTGARGLAMSLMRAPSPGAPLELRVAAAGPRPVVVRDAGGVLDSVRVSGVAAWRLASAAAPLHVQQGGSEARVPVPPVAAARRLLVMAEPGWEGKFVVAALEEAGWAVDGTMRVSPTGAVTVGVPQRLDTARYAAVVVVDSMAVDAGRVMTFVTQGGGLVLAGDALRVASLAPLRPARATAVRPPIAGALLTGTPRHGLEAWELAPVADAVVLAVDEGDHGHDEPALVARRVGRGRVAAMPYRETWRWRMQGTDDGAADHRGWWQGAVQAVVGSPPPRAGAGVQAPLPPVASRGGLPDVLPDALPGAAAPYADLVARLGAPAERGDAAGDAAGNAAGNAAADTAGGVAAGDEWAPDGDIPERAGRSRGQPDRPGRVTPAALLLVALLALLAEWASRRLRGLR